MSMRDYAVHDFGMIIDEETGLMICQALGHEFDKNDEDISGEISDVLYENGIVDMIGQFTGEAIAIQSTGYEDFSDTIFYNDEAIMFVGLRFPTLFKAVYKDVTDIIIDLKSKVGKYLPDDFDYRKNIRFIVGTYWG